MPEIVRQILGLQVRTVAETRTDWMPSDAVYPVPWRSDVLTVDLVIERDGDGFCFRYASRDAAFGDVSHHATAEEAEAEARRIFGEPLEWQTVAGD